MPRYSEKDPDLTSVIKLKRVSTPHTNRVRQATTGTWYFKFTMGGIKYFQKNFETSQQAEQALQLQYQVLNLTTTGQKLDKGRKTRSAKDHRERAKPVRVEKGVYLLYNGKYKADILVQTNRFTKTCETIEQARAFIAEHKKQRKKRVCVKPRQPRQPMQPRQQKTPAEKIAELIQKTQRAKKVNIAAGELNKGIALLNNAERPLIKKKKPTISELLLVAKKHQNPRQYYIEQLRSGAYRG